MTQVSRSGWSTDESEGIQASVRPVGHPTPRPPIVTVRVEIDEHGLRVATDHVRTERDFDQAIDAADSSRDPEFGRPD